MVICDLYPEHLRIGQSIVNIGRLFTCLNARQMIGARIQPSWLNNDLKFKFLKKKQPSTDLSPQHRLVDQVLQSIMVCENFEVTSQ